MKEKARKLRYSLSKRRQEDENVTPSWGVSLEDAEEEDADAEYLGAPMYESEEAPEVYKENARQHPRANPVISEKHVLQTNVKARVEQQDQDHKPLSPVKFTTTTTQPSTTTITTTPPPASNTTRNEKVSEKLIPAYAEGSDDDAANSISSKIEGLAVSTTPSANVSPQDSPSLASLTSSSSFPVNGKNTSPNGGASVKEYLKIKFEPGGDEKALSHVISEAMSPRKATHNAGVMEKVRGAVNSLLRNDEPSQKCAVKTTTAGNSFQTTNAQQVGHEGNHGRTLQAN